MKIGDKLPNGAVVVMVAASDRGRKYVLARWQGTAPEYAVWRLSYDGEGGPVTHHGTYYPWHGRSEAAALMDAVAGLRSRVGEV